MSDPSTDTQGYRPATPAGAKAFITTPFARLARTHAGSTMADAMVTAALADSLFFSLPADDARGPVIRYLIITMLPFAVISPLIGPLIDRLKGGHRFVLIGTMVARTILCYLMIGQINEVDTTSGVFLFFGLALGVLVSQRAYSVARSALVPTVVANDAELVEANSKLSLISGISGFVGIVPAAAVIKIPFMGPGWALGMAGLTYLVAGVLGSKIPAGRVASSKADETERHELRGAGIVLAGSAMGLIRMCVGFLTLLIAFDFRGGDRSPAAFAVVGAASVLSQQLGAVAAPRLRALTSEENILTGVLGGIVMGGLLSLVLGDVAGATILGATVGFAAGAGKLAFDSILQRDAPDANRGRSFAKFETRFQVTWVIGAFTPVALNLGARAGFVVVFLVAVVALASYVVGRLAWAHKTGARQTAATAAAVGIEARFAEVSGEVRGRLRAAPRSAFRRLRGPYEDGPGPEHDAVPDGRFGEYDGDDPRVVRQPAGPAVPGGRASATDAPTDPPRTDLIDDDLASASRVAWQPTAPRPQAPPPSADPEFPWQAPQDPATASDAYLADVDPSVNNPFPWTPDPEAPTQWEGDDPTVPIRPDPPTSRHRHRPHRRDHGRRRDPGDGSGTGGAGDAY